MKSAIKVTALQKRYANGYQALKSLSFEIKKGEFFALLGPNGAGKSTLINTMAGLVRPTFGSVEIMGYDVVRNRENALMNIGVVPQEVIYDPFLTVWETLRFQSGYFGLTRNNQWIEELIETLGLSEKASSPVRMLSGGMKRRVLVAQALVHRPAVIVLDEPTAGVDVQLRAQLWSFFKRLHAQGHTIVLTTHYLEEAQHLCQRVALLNRGELVEVSPIEALLDRFGKNTLKFHLASGTLPQDLMSRICFQKGEDYLMTYTDTYDLNDALVRLLQSGCVVQELCTDKASLEEVFLNLMEKSAVNE